MSSIWIGTPKYHLCLCLAEHFSNCRHAFFQKGLLVCKTICVIRKNIGYKEKHKKGHHKGIGRAI